MGSRRSLFAVTCPQSHYLAAKYYETELCHGGVDQNEINKRKNCQTPNDYMKVMSNYKQILVYALKLNATINFK